MKRIVRYIIILLAVFPVTLYAQQEELPTDSIRITFDNQVRQFGDFLLDMTLFEPIAISQMSLREMLPQNVAKDYSYLFQADNKLTLSTLSSFSIGGRQLSTTYNLQQATFRLTDRITLSTYGQYKYDGSKAANTNPLPWNRDNFMGGFELKFNNGFSFRMEMKTNNHYLAPPF